MNKIILITAGVLIVITGGYFLLRGSYQTPASSPVPTPSPVQTQTQTQTPTAAPEEIAKPTETPPATQAPVSQTTEINVAGTEFSFSPASINVKTGERVKIIFSNKGGAPHNLTLEGLGIATKTIGGGQTDVVEFTAPSSGTYVFFCSVASHRAFGMEGSLKVK